ncbi:MAG: hypothetical protein ACKV2O_24735 [Acidimicrobiales bacterium]
MGTARLVVAALLGAGVVGGCGFLGAERSVETVGQEPVTVTDASGAAAPSTNAPEATTALNPSGSTDTSGTQRPVVVNVPAVDVVDVATGATQTLASLIATDRPTLLWMWAPY